MQLGCGGFKNYPELGYSICCPARGWLVYCCFLKSEIFFYSLGPMCSSSPIADPHHFYLVDEKKSFV